MEKFSKVLYYSAVWLHHISYTCFMWPVRLKNILSASVQRLQYLSFPFASWPWCSICRYYLKPSMTLNISSTKVSKFQSIKKVFIYSRWLCEKKIIVGLSYPKSKKHFHKTNRQVEKCSEIIYFIISKVSPPVYVLPKAFFSLFIYFTTDKKQDAFMLPLPTWFVHDIDWCTFIE